MSGAAPGGPTADPIKVHGLNCPNCGAAIQLRGFQYTQRVICDSCCAVLDALDANYAVLQKFGARLARHTPLIPLGARGQWKGEPWEVIGFQVRTITVEGLDYSWHEYLLFNPFLGFRYLTQYNGHWCDVTTLRALPESGSANGHPTARWRDTEFRAFQTSVAVTTFAVGEFPWAVAVGDRVTAHDFVSPPLMLSSETTEEEITWSLGEYVSGERVWASFRCEGDPPPPAGAYANQPNPLAGRVGALWRTCGVLVIALVALGLLRGATAADATAFRAAYSFAPGAGDTAAFVTDAFELGGGTSNVLLSTQATVDNSWLFVHYTLVNEETGTALDVGREVSFYHGSDSDGPWSEGSHEDAVRLPAVASGRWFLRIDPEGPSTGRPIGYTVQVQRDTAGILPFVAALVMLLVPPIVTSLRSHAFETARWAESDYAPVAADDGDD